MQLILVNSLRKEVSVTQKDLQKDKMKDFQSLHLNINPFPVHPVANKPKQKHIGDSEQQRSVEVAQPALEKVLVDPAVQTYSSNTGQTHQPYNYPG